MSELDLVVVGAGPTGIAALFEAHRSGLRALAVEAGPSVLASVAGYLEGLIFLSPSWHYEVGRIPLDCRDPDELTREEVLHYYARIVRYAALDIRTATRCVKLVPHPTGVRVDVETRQGRSSIHAAHVVVAAWYERRPPPAALAPRHDVDVVPSLPHALAAAHRRVVIVGSGMSALEHATTLMMSGQQFTLLSRGPLPSYFSVPAFADLVAATGSELVVNATEIATEEGGVTWRVDGTSHRRRADLVIASLGPRLSPQITAMLVDAGVITEDIVAQLERAPTAEQLVRTGLPPEIARQRAHAQRPDLWRQVFEGVNRIRLAGGALHSGGADAGVLSSIQTAALAVRSLSGRPAELASPLPETLGRWAETVDPGLLPTWESVAHLRPVAIRSSTRTTPRFFIESTTGSIQLRSDDPTASVTARFPDAVELVRACDGTVSIAQLAEAMSAETDEDRTMLVQALCNLFRRNVLMWIPPARQGEQD